MFRIFSLLFISFSLLTLSWAQEESVPVEAPQQITQEFLIQYQSAAVVAVEVESLLTPETGVLKMDQEQNTLTITDTFDALANIKQAIEKIDQKKKSIYLEARVVQIILNDEHAQGVDWEAAISNYQHLNLNGSLQDKRSLIKQLSIGTVGAEDYEPLLEALDTVGAIYTLARPNVVTQDQGEAYLMMSLKEPYVISLSEGSPYDHFVSHAREASFENRIHFSIQPKIDIDGSITTVIESSANNFRERVEALTNKNNGARDQTSLPLTLQEGESIIIGGLLKSEQRVKQTFKIPFLGDLPILGFAFRNANHSTRKTEFILLLTPRIMPDEPSDQ